MNKRQRKKRAKNNGYKCYLRRLKKCKNLTDYFNVIYPARIIKKLIYQANPFFMSRPKNESLFFKPVILGLEMGVTFAKS